VRVEHEGREIDVDTGFIVFNERNYPAFCRLMDELGIDAIDAPMTFGVRDDRTGLEYGGASLNALLAQRRNALSPRFLGMIRDILRFFREAPRSLEHEPEDATLGEYLARQGYGRAMIEQFLVPMGGAIWSSPNSGMLDFPLHFFVRFFENHGMLTLSDRPQWRTIRGGSKRYVDEIARRLEEAGSDVRLSTPVMGVRRGATSSGATQVWFVEDGRERVELFDHVIFACHSDQAQRILGEDATNKEREILGRIPYQANDVVLHTDQSLMPQSRRAWSAWVSRIPRDDWTGSRSHALVTYDLTVLQSLGTREHLLVSLNQTQDIDPARILARFTYDHPVFTLDGENAKGRYSEIGSGRTSFCGAYWFNGFHEDGVRSALRVVEHVRRLARSTATRDSDRDTISAVEAGSGEPVIGGAA
jgi:predicted NAD/FAD-binding protein